MNGILLVDKPVRLTSHDVVDCIRRVSGIRRIGHTGTLDPAATGLLVLCVGAATRLSEHLTGLNKVYEGAMRFGIVTDSYDLDGKVVETNPVPTLTLEQIQTACNRFVGDIMQVPPMVSAVKVGGERLYKRARQGEIVEREARPVKVLEFRATEYNEPDAAILVRCTRGTYVRALCHDVGHDLGCGATLAALRRTFVGHYSVADALPVDGFATRQDVLDRLLSIDTALELPEVFVAPRMRNLVVTGGSLGPGDVAGGCSVREGWVQIKLESGKLLALGQVEPAGAGVRIHAKRILVS
jgi:tRNA pseudouridine55 synthase